MGTAPAHWQGSGEKARTACRLLVLCGDRTERARLKGMLAHRAGAYEVAWLSGYGAAVRALAQDGHDVVLLDERFDGGNGLNLLRQAQDARAAVPIVLIGDDGDDAGRGAGAADRLQREELTAALLDRALRYAVDSRRAAERISYLSHYDPVTGLANRTLFRDQLNRAIAEARRRDRMLAMILVAVDRFAPVQESLGHAGADVLMQSIAARILGCLPGGPDSDALARLAGEEFALVLEDLDALEDAARVAERIGEALTPPFEVAGHELFATAAIGIATYPLCGWNADTLTTSATTAAWRAREIGRNAHQFYTRKMTARELQRLVLQTSLHKALERGEFQLYYQAQVDLADGRLTAAEALLRWHHPEFGLLLPDQFVPIAEETGLIIPVGKWVMEQACAQARHWDALEQAPRRVAVNLSASQFRDPGLAGTIAVALERTGLAPERLAVELTESVLMEDTEGSSASLRRLRDMGLHVAIDDFGTGYSSLGYLKRFPIDALKIDKSFVRDVTTDPDDAAIATAVIGLAHNLRLDVVAEGVETAEQLAFLRTRSCDAVQGFLYSPPMPADEFAGFLAGWRGWAA